MTTLAKTLGELKRTAYRSQTVRAEIRANLRRKLAAKQELFPGIVGYDRTVIPSIANALLAGHDFILLGLRGQAKSRLLRQLTTLLDPQIPVLAGSEVNDDPLAPISTWGARRIAEAGDDAPIEWLGPRGALQREDSPPRTSRSPTSSATSIRSRRRPAGSPTPTPRSSTSASFRAPTAASSRSTSCPTSRRASRSAC